MIDCLGVEPGDPFPNEDTNSKTFTSEDLINGNDVIESKQTKIPSSPKSLTHLTDFIDTENIPMDHTTAPPPPPPTSTTTKSSDHIDDEDILKKNNLNEKSLSQNSSTKLISKKK